MAHIEIVRGVETDILIRLRTKPNGPLVDDEDWVDGSTAEEWPTITVRTVAGADKTSDWVKDITGDSVSAPKLKHPDPTTGIIRDEQGKYRVRVDPSPSLAADPTTYKLYVTFDVGESSFEEVHNLSLKVAGDVEVGAEFNYASEDEVTDNFELETVVTVTQVQKALTAAERRVDSFLQAEELTTPWPSKIPALTEAAVAFARAELRRVISATTGAGLGVQSIREGDTEFRFVSPDRQFDALYQEGERWVHLAITAIKGSFYFSRSSMNSAER